MRSELRPFVYEGLSVPPVRPDTETAPPRPAARPGAPLRGARCNVREVLDRFARDSHRLEPAHRARIRRIAECVRDSQRGPRPIRNIRVVGHASTEGSGAHNLTLGRQRATEVLNRLRSELESVQRGLSARVTLSADSRGEREPTGRGRELDRRVEILLPRLGGARPPRPPQPRRGCPPQRERIRLHLKILADPAVPIATMLRAMREVYGPAGFRVEVASTERLRLPTLVDLDLHCPGNVAATCCPFPCASPTLNAEVVTLFGNRRRVRPNDVVVYFVRTTSPTLNGCCAHPPGRPGVVVTSIASRFTMAHEIGHILGLPHVASTDRLMTGAGTGNITNPPPDLVPSEVQTMTASPLTVPC